MRSGRSGRVRPEPGTAAAHQQALVYEDPMPPFLARRLNQQAVSGTESVSVQRARPAAAKSPVDQFLDKEINFRCLLGFIQNTPEASEYIKQYNIARFTISGVITDASEFADLEKAYKKKHGDSIIIQSSWENEAEEMLRDYIIAKRRSEQKEIEWKERGEEHDLFTTGRDGIRARIAGIPARRGSHEEEEHSVAVTRTSHRCVML